MDLEKFVCPACNKENYISHTFCYFCGSSLVDMEFEILVLNDEIVILPEESRTEYINIENKGAGMLEVNTALTLKRGRPCDGLLDFRNREFKLKAGEATGVELLINTRNKELKGGEKYFFELKFESNSLRGVRDEFEKESRYWDRWCKEVIKKDIKVSIEQPPELRIGPSLEVDLDDVVQAKEKTFENRLYVKNSGGGKISLLINFVEEYKKAWYEIDERILEALGQSISEEKLIELIKFFNNEVILLEELESKLEEDKFTEDEIGEIIRYAYKELDHCPGNFLFFPVEEFELTQQSSKYVNFTIPLKELTVNHYYFFKFHIKDRVSGNLKLIQIKFRLVAIQTVRPVIGIDFGTSSSKVATLGKETIELIKIQNEETFPSLIYVDNTGNIIVGDEAKAYFGMEGFIRSIKSLLRREDQEIIIHGEKYSVISLIGIFLRNLFSCITREREIIELFGQGIKAEDVDLIVTIPVRAREKHETKMLTLLKKIGFKKVNVAVESTAAAQFYIQDDLELADQNILVVFDCGAGTTDLSVLKIKLRREDDGSYTRVFEVLSEQGIDIGGDDIDDYFYDYIKDKLGLDEKKKLKERENESLFKKRYYPLLKELENIKISFSLDKEDKVLKVPGLISGIKISCDDFEKAISPIVDDLFNLLHLTLKMADIQPANVDKAYLVGGTSYISMIEDRLRKIFDSERVLGGRERLTCVARGGVAGKLLKTRNVLAFYYGYTVRGIRGPVQIGLKRGLIYPVKRHRSIFIPPNVTEVYTEIYIHKSETMEEMSDTKGVELSRIICDIDNITNVRSMEIHFEINEHGNFDCYVVYDPDGVNKRFNSIPI